MKTKVCLKGYSKAKNGKCRKIAVPKIGTVCLEGYKISKNGKCVKDKKYAIIASSSLSSKTPAVPTVCLEGYKYSSTTGKCRKIVVAVPTICREGFKMTKNGRCIKDKAYTTVFSSAKLEELPSLTPSMAASVSAPVQLANAESAQEVKELLAESNVTITTQEAKEIAKAETPQQVSAVIEEIAAKPVVAEVTAELASANTSSEVKELLAEKGIEVTAKVASDIANATTPQEVVKIIEDVAPTNASSIPIPPPPPPPPQPKNSSSPPPPPPPPKQPVSILEGITAGVILKKREFPTKSGLSTPLDELRAGQFKLKPSSERILKAGPIQDNSKVKEKASQFRKALFDDIKSGHKLRSIGPSVPLTSEIENVIAGSNPVEFKLVEAENYVKNVFEKHGIEYTGCSSLKEALAKFRAQCVKEIGYETNLPHTQCIKRHIDTVQKSYPALSKNLEIIGCIINDKLIEEFA